MICRMIKYLFIIQSLKQIMFSSTVVRQTEDHKTGFPEESPPCTRRHHAQRAWSFPRRSGDSSQRSQHCLPCRSYDQFPGEKTSRLPSFVHPLKTKKTRSKLSAMPLLRWMFRWEEVTMTEVGLLLEDQFTLRKEVKVIYHATAQVTIHAYFPATL